MEKQQLITRGRKNNNPLNIEYNPRTVWMGRERPLSDPRFECFSDVHFGLRAAIKILRTYIAPPPLGRGCDCIEKIIKRWAPASENNTQAYINYVSAKSGIQPTEKILFKERDKIIRLVHAMAIFESNWNIDLSVIRHAYDVI